MSDHSDLKYTLPAPVDAELALSLERAHRETRVLDLLVGVWALLLAKCCLLQAAIFYWSIPISGLFYIWALSLTLGALATFHYLRAHRTELKIIPTNRRTGSALLFGIFVTLAGSAHAVFALQLATPSALASLACSLGGIYACVHGTMRRRPEPLIGALIWWIAAWQCLRQPADFALVGVGLGLIFGQALPAFALVRAANRYRA
jgi:hypothetical protein